MVSKEQDSAFYVKLPEGSKIIKDFPYRNLSTFLDQSVNIWFTEKRDKQVILKVDKEVAVYFRQQVYFPLQKIKKEDKDGSLMIESKICHNEEILRIIFRWIPYVHVIKPKSLRVEVEEIVKGCLENI